MLYKDYGYLPNQFICIYCTICVGYYKILFQIFWKDKKNTNKYIMSIMFVYTQIYSNSNQNDLILFYLKSFEKITKMQTKILCQSCLYIHKFIQTVIKII